MTKKFIMILIVGVIGLAILVYLLGNQIDIFRKDDMTITEITGYPITNCIYQKGKSLEFKRIFTKIS